MQLLDRYILKNFFVPFALCFLGFIAIWLIFDLADNGGDFIDASVPLANVGEFYLRQLPQIVVISLPAGLLLALLYSLSRMSRNNEVLAILGAGRGMLRMVLPLMLCGLAATGLSLWLNYELAPRAEADRKVQLEVLTKGRDKQNTLRAQVFRNRGTNRTWFVQNMKRRSNELRGLHVIEQDAEGNIVRKFYAALATHDARSGRWILDDGKTVTLDTEGNQTGEERWDRLVKEDWPETPWRVASSNLDAQHLSVPELREYLRLNADFPPSQLAPYRTQLEHRLALPWACFIVIFIAAPLGIVFSRRGVLAGVASSLFIFFGMMMLQNLFLALGKGERISPEVAAWVPNAFFALLGLFLLWMRSGNRDFTQVLPRRAAPRPKPTIRELQSTIRPSTSAGPSAIQPHV